MLLQITVSPVLSEGVTDNAGAASSKLYSSLLFLLINCIQNSRFLCVATIYVCASCGFPLLSTSLTVFPQVIFMILKDIILAFYEWESRLGGVAFLEVVQRAGGSIWL